MRLLERLGDFGMLDPSAQPPAERSLRDILNEFPQKNVKGKLCHKLCDYHIGGSSLSFVSSHQNVKEKPPVPCLAALNQKADEYARQEADKDIPTPLLPSGCVKGKVSVPAGTNRVHVLLNGDALNGDVGDILQSYCTTKLYEDLLGKYLDENGATGEKFRVQWDPAASPVLY
jgi:hypothetical protein